MAEKKQSERFLKQSHVSAFRLTRHHLTDQTQAELATVCHDVCGIQAQMTAFAEIALWARMHRITRADIHTALWTRRTLVKTSCMRQTLHLIPATDFSIFIGALKRSRMEALMRIMSKFGITPKETEVLNGAIIEALRAGPMTQPELIQQILPKAGKKIRTYREYAWSIQLFRAALVSGLICYGPERGKKMTFVRVDQWLPKQNPVDEQKAKQTLLRRYLRSYGPATLQDFSKWSGISLKEAKGVWGSLDGELAEVSMETKSGSILRKDYKKLAKSDLAEPTLRLLPSFDPYLLGHAEKNHLVDDRHYKRVYRNAGWLSPVILLNGRVVGIWSYARRGARGVLSVTPFERFSKIIHAKIEEEAASLGAFLETSLEINFGR